MSRTKRHIPHWATPDKAKELTDSWPGFNPEREPFFIGSDKLGRKNPIGDPETRDEVWGEGNKRKLRTRLNRKERRKGKAIASEGALDE